MNSLTHRKIKISNCFLILLIVFAFSCDDFFVEDISTYNMQLKTPSSGWKSEDKRISFRWEDVPKAVNYKLEVVTPGFAVNHKLVFEKLLQTAKFDTTLMPGEYEWRVKAKNSASETDFFTSPFSVLPEFNISSKQILLMSPEDQAVGKVKNVNFKWEALSGTSYYSFKIKKENWAGDTIVVSKLYSTNYTFRLEDGIYSWGVAAIDTLNQKRTDYTIRSFIVDQNPPSVPILVNPANQDTVSSVVVGFKWRKTEQKANYAIEIYSDLELKNRLQEKTLSDTLTYIDLGKNGIYYWRVNSTDEHGNIGGFSPVSLFCIRLSSDINLKVVQIMSPADKSTIIDKKVTFWWNFLDGATKYNLQVVSPSFANPTKLIYDQWLTSNSMVVDLEAGNYEWRVKAANSVYQTGFTQSTFSIYSNDLSKQKTTLLSPLYGQQINKSLVKLSWAKINSNASYQLLIKKDSWESGSIVQDMKTDKIENEVSLSDGDYYWGVKAIDPVNNSETEYSIRKFEVAIKVDLSGTKVSLLSPTDKSTIVDKKITLWWNQVTGAEKYNLQIVSPSFANPTKLIYDQWITTNSFVTELDAGNYEWRVKASNSISETAFSTYSLSIYVNDLSKQKVSLLKPIYAEQLNLSSIKFSWEKLSNNLNYNLLVKKDSWESGNTVQEISTTKTEMELALLEGNFYWGVKATDPLNNSETVYSVRNFVVDLTAPDIPTLKTPANNFTTSDLLVNFSWEQSDVTDTKLTYTFEMFQINPISVVQLSSKTTQQKSLGYNLESFGKYKWRVYATDTAGNKGAYSEFRYFEIK